MAHYQYKFTLSDQEIAHHYAPVREGLEQTADLTPEGVMIVRAAMTVAHSAHHGQSRDKVDRGINYITHPIMVYDILRRMGECDPALLGAALLHDAIEDNSKFLGKPRAVYRRLIDQLNHKLSWYDQVTQETLAHVTAEHIAQWCREVTNPKIFEGGSKEHYQRDRVDGMSLEAKKIKIVDQTASLICNLTMANDPAKFSPEKATKFADKAHALVVNIFESVQHDPRAVRELGPYASLFGRVLEAARPLIDAPTEAAQANLRRSFDYDALFAQQKYIDILPKRVATGGVFHFSLRTGKPGLTWVEFDTRGDVKRYAVAVDRRTQEQMAKDQPVQNPGNVAAPTMKPETMPQREYTTLQDSLKDEVRSRMHRYCKYGNKHVAPSEILVLPKAKKNLFTDEHAPHDGLERVFELFPPFDRKQFCLAALHCGAMEHADMQQMEKARHVQQTEVAASSLG